MNMELPDFELLETMRWEQGVSLIERHLIRLKAASKALEFDFSEAKVRATIANYDHILNGDLAYRLRLTMSREGVCRVTFAPVSETVPFATAIVDSSGMDASDSFRKFKTTRREVYESALRQAQEDGFDEVISTNLKANIVEGTRTNVWARFEDVWKTPPLSSGCLGGVYRRHLLDTRSDTVECEITVSELYVADEIALSNAVHGLNTIQLGG